MAAQGKILKLFNVLGTYRNAFGNSTNRCAYPCYQQVAYITKEQQAEWKNLPQPPKKPLTPYFKFMTDLRPELTKDNKMKLTDFVKEAALRWEKVDSQIKQKMEEEYRREQEIYTKRKLDFETSLSAEQKNAMKEAKIAKAEDRQKRKYRKKAPKSSTRKKDCNGNLPPLPKNRP